MGQNHLPPWSLWECLGPRMRPSSPYSSQVLQQSFVVYDKECWRVLDVFEKEWQVMSHCE